VKNYCILLKSDDKNRLLMMKDKFELFGAVNEKYGSDLVAGALLIDEHWVIWAFEDWGDSILSQTQKVFHFPYDAINYLWEYRGNFTTGAQI
jgi:hypothetical protein